MQTLFLNRGDQCGQAQSDPSRRLSRHGISLHLLHRALAGLICLSLFSCGDQERVTITQDSVNTIADPVAVYNIATGDIPFPNIALYSQTDKTINIPDLDESDYSNPQVAMNASWGFSTSAPLKANFSQTPSAASLPAGVKMYRLLFDPNTQGQATLAAILSDPATQCASAVSSLALPSEYYPSLSGDSLIISPTKVLSPQSLYLVVVTDSVTTDSGTPFKADVIYQLLQGSNPLYDASSNTSLVGFTTNPAEAASLEALRQLTNLTEAVAKICDAANIGSSNIVVSWVFNTSPAGSQLQAVKTLVPATVASSIVPTGASTPANAGDIYVGTVSLPYYLTKASNASDTSIKSQFWKNSSNSYLTVANPLPRPTDTLDVPLLVTVPIISKFPKASQKGVVIFQHGITSNRSALFGIADTLANSGYVAVAIDLPLHGIKADDSNPSIAALYQAGHERNFDVDLDGDGVVDDSGAYFINLENLLVTRDNVQQSVADLFALRQAIETMDYDGGGADFAGKDVFFVGHSLGAIVGIPFVALDTSIKAAVFGMPGGGLPKVLDGSDAFGPVIAAGLAAAGISKGSADYEGFMLATQTVLDITDPLNFAATLNADSRGLLGISVHNDLVVPNIVPDIVSPSGTVAAPLAGTNPLFATMGLQQLQTTTNSATPLHVWVEFGESLAMTTNVCQDVLNPTLVLHKTMLSPYNEDNTAIQTESAQVMAEMQHEVAAFLESNGNSLNIADNTYFCAH